MKYSFNTYHRLSTVVGNGLDIVTDPEESQLSGVDGDVIKK